MSKQRHGSRNVDSARGFFGSLVHFVCSEPALNDGGSDIYQYSIKHVMIHMMNMYISYQEFIYIYTQYVFTLYTNQINNNG